MSAHEPSRSGGLTVVSVRSLSSCGIIAKRYATEEEARNAGHETRFEHSGAIERFPYLINSNYVT